MLFYEKLQQKNTIHVFFILFQFVKKNSAYIPISIISIIFVFEIAIFGVLGTNYCSRSSAFQAIEKILNFGEVKPIWAWKMQ